MPGLVCSGTERGGRLRANDVTSSAAFWNALAWAIFAGAYVAGLLRGLSHREAARLANGVGALVVQTLGAVDGVLDWQGTMEWMGRDRSVNLPAT